MAQTSHSPSTLDKVTFQDGLMAVIGFLFTVAGLFVLKSDFNVGVTSLAFFGSCFAYAVYVIVRKLRRQRQSRISVTVAGGVPIRASRVRIALLGLGFSGVGTLLTLFRPDDNKIYLVCVALMAAVGYLLLLGLAAGVLTRDFIQFDPAGITVGGRRGRAIVPWSAIAQAARGEVHGSQAVLLWVDRAAVTAAPASYLAAVRKEMSSCNAWLGADFAILSSKFGIDAPVLLAAIERYAASPETRDELQAVPAVRA